MAGLHLLREDRVHEPVSETLGKDLQHKPAELLVGSTDGKFCDSKRHGLGDDDAGIIHFDSLSDVWISLTKGLSLSHQGIGRNIGLHVGGVQVDHVDAMGS